MRIYNTLSRSIEEFKPIDPTNVRIYSCGPTVYSRQHLGNMRAAFIIDLLKNTLRHICGYEVIHVMNVTDVGHLTDDADQGEDKMEKGARKEGTTARDVAKKFTDLYLADLEILHIDSFDVMPRATEHITEQITMVKELEDKGYTYIIDNDGVYMDTSKVKDYGKLTNKKNIEGILVGARIDGDKKRNPTDFALRKFNTTGKKRDMERESPRGIGFPGRHIECSAMSMKYLGDHFDIHTGGMEHIPIHHTNEICQSECSHANTPRVNYWVHNQRLTLNGKKISKSDGNTIYIDDIIERGYSAKDLRYFFLQAHYRSFQDFTREQLDAAKKSRNNLKKILSPYQNISASMGLQDDISYLSEVLLDDLNTPKLLARLRAGQEAFDQQLASAIKYLDDKVLKIGLFESEDTISIEIPEHIKSLAEVRRQAKINKNRDIADQLKQQIIEAGRQIKDGKEGYEIVLIS